MVGRDKIDAILESSKTSGTDKRFVFFRKQGGNNIEASDRGKTGSKLLKRGFLSGGSKTDLATAALTAASPSIGLANGSHCGEGRNERFNKEECSKQKERPNEAGKNGRRRERLRRELGVNEGTVRGGGR